MLEKVIAINNIGVLQAATPNAMSLGKLTLVYADNARGKSTLSTLLRACSDGDADTIAKRKTFGATTPQKVLLRFQANSAGFNVEFDGAAWSATRPRLYVFNQEFVEKNVFTSNGVLPEQREALLDFALGDAAVAQRAEFDKQGELQRLSAGEVSAAEKALQGYRGAYTVEEFIALEPLADVEGQIEAVDKSIGEARDADRIRNRPGFRKVQVPSYDFESLKRVLGSSFESVSDGAEGLVKRHFAAHNESSTERWVAEGLQHKPEPNCPFCGQSTEGLDLLKAYRSYFNTAYKEYLVSVNALPERIRSAMSESTLNDWTSAIEFNSGVLSGWASSLELVEAPPLDVEGCRALIQMTQVELLDVARQKVEDPLVAAPVEAFDKALQSLRAVIDAATEFNTRIDTLNAEIEELKASLATADMQALQSKRQDLVTRQQRYESSVVELIQSVCIARQDYKAAERAKDEAKKRLDAQMEATLAQFQTAINEWLGKFGAPFSVRQLTPTYRGGGVRSEYVLDVRGATVKVGPASDGDLAFHVALSEGDKRTLAFAFFLARLFADPIRNGAVVVLDDVFTSLDRHRRHQTADAVVKMAAECAQVIALGHDAHFLRELKKRAAKKKVGAAVELALHRDANDYSFIDSFDLDDYCSSDYYKHYVLVERFVGGDHTANLLEVAKALRPLIEGHLHRCFPKKFKDGLTVGDMLEQIRTAVAPSPLTKLQPHLDNLVAFNDYASAFHHDTSGGDTRTETNAAELLPFARGALGFIQARSFG